MTETVARTEEMAGLEEAIEALVGAMERTGRWSESDARTDLRPVIDAAIHLSGNERVTHGRHCTCTPCRNEDWTQTRLAPCGMHGKSCARAYAPMGRAGQVVPAAGSPR